MVLNGASTCMKKLPKVGGLSNQKIKQKNKIAIPVKMLVEIFQQQSVQCLLAVIILNLLSQHIYSNHQVVPQLTVHAPS